MNILRAFLLFSVVSIATAYAHSDLRFATPEEVGMSSERLETLRVWAEDAVESYPLTGAITLVARHGKIVEFETYGYRDKLRGVEMTKDTIFRLHSMTKTIATAAAMILVERGQIQLNDPVEKHLPELANRNVYVAEGSSPTTRPAKGKMLVKHLFTHTAGFPRASGDSTELDKRYVASGLRSAPSLDAYLKILGELPLQDDPGTVYQYGPSIDVVGALVQRVSGVPFDDFLQEEIFDPLGMKDTFFEVPVEKRDRLIPGFKRVDGKLAYEENAHDGGMRTPYPSGSGGLYSTVQDYFRFAQMLLNGGTYNGVSVLGKLTVRSMMQNQTGFLDFDKGHSNRSLAYGYGGSVKISQYYDNKLTNVGEFGWGGAGTTWYRLDPKEDFLVLFFTQHYPMASSLTTPFMNTAIQAIVE